MKIIKHEKAVGPLGTIQISLQMSANDMSNDINKRKYANELVEWIGNIEVSIDELFEFSYVKSNFILDTLEKYEIKSTNSNILMNYSDAIESLRYQKKTF